MIEGNIIPRILTENDMDDVDRLTQNSHLSYGAAHSLLNTRTLSGDPEEHEDPSIRVTEDKVIFTSECTCQATEEIAGSTIRVSR